MSFWSLVRSADGQYVITKYLDIFEDMSVLYLSGSLDRSTQ